MRKYLCLLLVFLALNSVVQAQPSPPPTEKAYSNPVLGIDYQAQPGCWLVTDPAFVQRMREKGGEILKPSQSMQESMKRVGSHFIVFLLNDEEKPTGASVNLVTEALGLGMKTTEDYRAAFVRSLVALPQYQELPRPAARLIDGREFQCVDFEAAMGRQGRMHLRSYICVDAERGLAVVITLGDLAGRFQESLTKLEAALGGFQFTAAPAQSLSFPRHEPDTASSNSVGHPAW